MNEMNIIYKKTSELKAYENNPRNNEEAVKYVANSIKEFGFKVPIIIDKENVIVAGHTRLKASQQLGLEEVPCIVADDLSEEQIKAFRLADNKVSEVANWDFDKLDQELEEIEFDMSDFGFGVPEILDDDIDGEDNSKENPYTDKTNIPQYEITGEEPFIEELCDTSKTDELLEKIEKSNVSEEQKDFLRKAACRHLLFDYGKIAEYYAHQDRKMQKLMEESALVIIDIKNAIANGYVVMRKEFENIIEENKNE